MENERYEQPVTGARPGEEAAEAGQEFPVFYMKDQNVPFINEEKESEPVQLDFDDIPVYEPDLSEETPVEAEAENETGQIFTAPPEFKAEFDKAQKQIYKSKEEKPVPPHVLERRRKQKTRRIVAMAVICLILVITAAAILTNLIKKWTRGETVNVGPLPSDEVKVVSVPVYYDYFAPVPAAKEVEDSYFSDALIIGDSRVQCLDLYGSGSFKTMLYSTSINVEKAFTCECAANDSGTCTLQSRLSSGNYKKVYLCLGLNELGWAYSDYFDSCYRELVEKVRNAAPDTVIYLTGIFPLSAGKDGLYDYLTNEKIREYNAIISLIASENHLYYLDTWEAMADADGYLTDSYTSDGINLTADGSAAWFRYFKSHTVDPSRFAN